MSLIPRISTCTTGKCGLLTLTEVSGIATAPADGSERWGDTEQGADVTAASLVITYPNGTEDTYDILSLIPALVTGSFALGSYSPLGGSYFVDGMYTIVYTIVTGNGTFTNTIKTYLTCQISCCVEAYFKNLPRIMCENCDYDAYLANALKMEALLKALRSAINSGLFDTADGILTMLQRLCDWDNCNCQ